MKPALIIGLLFLAFPADAFDEIDVEVGSDDGSNEQNLAYKLNAFELTQDSWLTEISPYIESESDDEIEYLVYENTVGNTWSAVYRSGLVECPDGEGFAPSGPLEIALEAGGVYAIGFYIDERDVRYFYQTGMGLPDEVEGVGEHLGAVWVTDQGASTMPDVIEDDHLTVVDCLCGFFAHLEMLAQ